MLATLVDNDVLIKCALYDVLDSLLLMGDKDGEAGLLGAARFVLRSRMRRMGDAAPEGSMEAFELFRAKCADLEPTESELELATALEEAAARKALALDSGESLLCAIALRRGLPLILTGDKRAIAAAEHVLDEVPEASQLQGRVACMEQIITSLVGMMGAGQVRSRVCASPQADKTLSICFSCSSPAWREGNILQGLASYVGHVRGAASLLLYPGESVPIRSR